MTSFTLTEDAELTYGTCRDPLPGHVDFAFPADRAGAVTFGVRIPGVRWAITLGVADARRLAGELQAILAQAPDGSPPPAVGLPSPPGPASPPETIDGPDWMGGGRPS